MENKLYSLTSPITARPKSGNLFSIFSRVKSSTISTCSKTQSSVDDREAVIEFNKDLVDQLGCELRTRDEQIRDLQEKVDQQVRVIQALEEGNMRVSSESTLRKARVRGLEMDKQELQGEINSAHEAVARQASKIQELLAAKEYVDEEREFDRSVNEDLNYKLVELGDKFEHQKEDLAELEHCLQQKDDEIQELEARLSAAQNDTNERTQQLECEMARLNEVSEGRAVILRELQTQHCHLKEAKTNADEKLQALDKENSALAKFVVIIKNESEGQVNKITQLEQRFAHLQQKLSEEQSKREAAEKRADKGGPRFAIGSPDLRSPRC